MKRKASPHATPHFLLDALKILINHANTISKNNPDLPTGDKEKKTKSHINEMLRFMSQIGTSICGSPLSFSIKEDAINFHSDGSLKEITLTEETASKLTATFKSKNQDSFLNLKTKKLSKAWGTPTPTQDGQKEEAGSDQETVNPIIELAIITLSTHLTPQAEDCSDEEPLLSQSHQAEEDITSAILNDVFSTFPEPHKTHFLTELKQQKDESLKKLAEAAEQQRALLEKEEAEQEELRDSKNLNRFNELIKLHAELVEGIEASPTAVKPHPGDFRINETRKRENFETDDLPTQFKIGENGHEGIVEIFDQFSTTQSTEKRNALLQVLGLITLAQAIESLMTFEGYTLKISHLQRNGVIELSSDGNLSKFELNVEKSSGENKQLIKLTSKRCSSTGPVKFNLGKNIDTLAPFKDSEFNLSDREQPDDPKSAAQAGFIQVVMAIKEYMRISFGGDSFESIITQPDPDKFKDYLNHVDEKVALLAPLCILDPASVKNHLYDDLIKDIVRKKMAGKYIDVEHQSLEKDLDKQLELLKESSKEQSDLPEQKKNFIIMLQRSDPERITEIFTECTESILKNQVGKPKSLLKSQVQAINAKKPEPTKVILDRTISNMCPQLFSMTKSVLIGNKEIIDGYIELITNIAMENNKLPGENKIDMVEVVSKWCTRESVTESDLMDKLKHIFHAAHEKNEKNPAARGEIFNLCPGLFYDAENLKSSLDDYVKTLLSREKLQCLAADRNIGRLKTLVESLNLKLTTLKQPSEQSKHNVKTAGSGPDMKLLFIQDSYMKIEAGLSETVEKLARFRENLSSSITKVKNLEAIIEKNKKPDPDATFPLNDILKLYSQGLQKALGSNGLMDWVDNLASDPSSIDENNVTIKDFILQQVAAAERAKQPEPEQSLEKKDKSPRLLFNSTLFKLPGSPHRRKNVQSTNEQPVEPRMANRRSPQQ